MTAPQCAWPTAALLSLATAAGAQTLAFDVDRYDARPGGVVVVTLMLDPQGTEVAGAVVTLGGGESGGEMLDWRRAEVASALSDDAFQVVAAPTPEDEPPGVRVVVFARRGDRPVLGADHALPIARVSVPVAVGVRGEADMAILGGPSPNGQPRHAVALQGSGEVKAIEEPVVARVRIEPAPPPPSADFSLTGTWPGWSYLPRRPAAAPGIPVGIGVVGEGLRVRAVKPDSFGSWESDSANFGPWITDAEPGALRVVDWTVGSNANGPATPPVRLRLDQMDGLRSHDVVVRDLESNGKDGVSITPRSDGRRYRQLVAATDQGPEASGWGAAFDLIQFGGEGTLGRGVWLSRMDQAIVGPEVLGGAVAMAEGDLAGAGGAGWKTGPAAPTAEVPAVAYLRGPRGLGVRLPAEPASATIGSWWMPLEFSPASADQSAWFRLTVTAEIEPGAALRWRVASANQEWQAAWRHEAPATPGPRPVDVWFATPPGLDGQPLLWAFDVVPAGPEAEMPAPGARPSVYVGGWRLARLDAPEVVAAR